MDVLTNTIYASEALFAYVNSTLRLARDLSAIRVSHISAQPSRRLLLRLLTPPLVSAVQALGRYEPSAFGNPSTLTSPRLARHGM